MRLAPILFALGCLGFAVAASGCDRGKLVRDKAVRIPASSTMAAGGQPTFVGTWAAAGTGCGHAAWVFTAVDLRSPGAVSCEIGAVTPTLAGYTIHSACSAGGASTPGRIVATMNGGPPPAGMTVQGGPFAEPVSLIRCST